MELKIFPHFGEKVPFFSCETFRLELYYNIYEMGSQDGESAREG